jgi:uncharacterized glyoxalase superfamily protein PhnB
MGNAPAPDGFNVVTAYLIIDGAEAELTFIQDVFGGEVRDRVDRDEGILMHAEICIGSSMIMMADATPEYPVQTAMLYVYVEDVDSTYKAALAAGATSEEEPKDQHYGDRTASVITARGVRWYMATHK